MANFDPATTSPAVAQQIASQIAELLGLDDSADHAAIDEALGTLFYLITGSTGGDDTSTPPTAQESAEQPPERKLSASELAACKATGCTPRDFLTAKTAFSRGGRR